MSSGKGDFVWTKLILWGSNQKWRTFNTHWRLWTTPSPRWPSRAHQGDVWHFWSCWQQRSSALRQTLRNNFTDQLLLWSSQHLFSLRGSVSIVTSACLKFLSKSWNAKNVTKLEGIKHKEMRQCLWLNIGTIQDWQYLPVPTQQNCLVYHIIRHESTLDVKIGLKRSLISISEDTISRLPCFGRPVCFWTTSRKSRPGLVLPPAQGTQKQQRWLRPGCQALGSSFLQVPKRSTNKMMNENYTTLRTKQTISIGKRLFLGTFSSKQERLKGRVFTNQVHEVEPHWKVCNQIVISLCNFWMLRTMLAHWVQ